MKTRHAQIYQPVIGNFLAWFIGFFFMSLTEYWNGSFAWVDGSWPFAIGLFLSVFWTTRLHAYREAYRIEVRKIVIKHYQRIIQRTLLAVLIGLLVHGLAEKSLAPIVLVRAGLCAVYLLSVFWLTFDFILNTDRGRETFYVSSWYKSSGLDRFFSRFNSPLFWLLSKILVFLIALHLYMQSFQW